jgi:hypothetical protein
VRPSDALTEKACRKDAPRHLYDVYPSHVLKGKVPAWVCAIPITETQIDAQGKHSLTEGQLQPAAASGVHTALQPAHQRTQHG